MVPIILLVLVLVGAVISAFVALGLAVANRRRIAIQEESFRRSLRRLDSLERRLPALEEDVVVAPKPALGRQALRDEDAPESLVPADLPYSSQAPANGAIARSEKESSPPSDAPVPLELGSKRSVAGLEERFGLRIFVWTGGVALLLAGVFLVKYSIENSLLPPAVRVTLAGAFGIALLGGAEWMRRRSARIAQSLAGAGVAVLFAAILASVILYELIPAVVGFALAAGVTALAVGLSLRYGPFVALLGLIGGFATPALLREGEPATGPTLTFLLLLEIGLMGVTRRRGWIPLSALTFVVSFLWALLYAIFWYSPASRFWIGGFVLGSTVVYIASAVRSADFDAGSGARPRSLLGLAWAAACSALALLAFLSVRGAYSPIELGMLAFLGLGCIALARIDLRYRGLPWVSAAVSLLMLLAWVLHSSLDGRALEIATFVPVAGGYWLLYVLGPYACAVRSARVNAWLSLSASAAVGFVAVAVFGLEGHPSLPEWYSPWMPPALVLAALVVLALPVWQRRRRSAEFETALGSLALGAAGAWALTVWWGFDLEWLASGWVLGAAVAALLVERLRIAVLRWAVIGLSAFAVVVLAVPGPFAAPIGSSLIFNHLLPEYGLAVLGFAFSAWRLCSAKERHELDLALVPALQVLAAITSVATATLLVRHGFHPNIAAPSSGLLEWGTYASVASIAGVVLLLVSKRERRSAIAVTGMSFSVAGLGITVLASTFFKNPAWVPEPVGETLIFNWLLYVFGLPLASSAVAAVLLARRGERDLANLLRAGALAVAVLLVGLEVRHGFHRGENGIMVATGIGLLEWATYAVAWMSLGLGVQGAARGLGRRELQSSGELIALGGIVAALAGPLVLVNPLWFAETVGRVVVANWLLYIYGATSVLALVTGRIAEARSFVARFASTAGLILLFALVSLEVRQAFHGEMLAGGRLEDAEMYAYSLAWVVFGALLLVLGIVRRSLALRHASLGVMLLAVAKVFVFDTSHLEGLYRVLSFLGLGVSLLVLGYLYQRFVFRSAAEA